MRNGLELCLKPKNNIVLTTLGGISESLVYSVRDILKQKFGFKRVQTVINHEVDHIRPHLDGEPRVRQSRESVEQAYHGKKVYIVNYLKAFDNRLSIETRRAASDWSDLVQVVQSLSSDGIPPETSAKLITRVLDVMKASKMSSHIEELQNLALPDLTKGIGARFMSSRFNPSTIAYQLSGQITAAVVGGADYIAVASPKTIFEWSHHFAKNLEEKDRYELFSLQRFFDQLQVSGAHTVIFIHPHAPEEGLAISTAHNLNNVMVYPQTFTVSSNRWILSPEKIYRNHDIFGPEFDPFGTIIRDKKESLDVQGLGELTKLLLYIAAPDEGAYKHNTKMMAKKHNLFCLKSLKERENEGLSSLLESDSIQDYLSQLKQHTNQATITVYICDDKMNSGSTANDEAMLRKRQVAEFNAKYETQYTVEVKLMVSHLRYSELWNIKHANLDEILCLDTVPYLPAMSEQLEMYDLSSKITVLKAAAEQVALGIATDYFLQEAHIAKGRRLITGNYRETTDKQLREKYGYRGPIVRLDKPAV